MYFAISKNRSDYLLIETLVTELKADAGETLKLDWTIEKDLQYQVLDVAGTVSAERVASVAGRLFPNIEELLPASPPH